MVLGDNSSGKSTLVKIQAGLYPKIDGEILLENQLVAPDRPQTAINAGFSFLFQDEINILPLSIAENIFLNNEGNRFFLQRKRLYQSSQSYLQAVDLVVDPRKNARELSRDDQVLVLLARAFATRPLILVIDEALMNLSRLHAKKFTHSLMKMIEEESRKIGDMVGFSQDWERIPDIESGFEQNVLDRGQPVWLHDESQLKSLFQDQHPLVGSIAWVPIKIRGKTAGVVQLFFDDPDITPDMEVIKTFANQRALAIENTRLLGLSALLQEAHHRIKNNLQSIISLLALQMEKQSSPEAVQAISQSINRVKAIATVHDLLSRDQKAGSYLNIRQIIQKLVDWYSVRLAECGVSLDFSGKDLFLPYRKATPLALAVNELLTNCLQHAFPNGKKGKVAIKVWENDQKILLSVRDNGVGLGGKDIDISHSEGHLGLWLVKTLVTGDLAGHFHLKDNEGTEAVISMSGQ